MRLDRLANQQSAEIESVEFLQAQDTIARRLEDLGFVAGEQVRVITRAPFGGDPILVQVGTSRFALRQEEARRVILLNGVDHE